VGPLVVHFYRLYVLDKAGHLVAPAMVIHAKDDEAAITEAAKRIDGVCDAEFAARTSADQEVSNSALSP